MKVITKGHIEYKCKLIDFTHNNVDEIDKVEITLWDEYVEYEEIDNIAYIKV